MVGDVRGEMTTDEHIERLSGRVDELHHGHQELKGQVGILGTRLTNYIDARKKQLEDDETRREAEEERADEEKRARRFWISIAVTIMAVVLAIILGALTTSTVAIIRGLQQIEQNRTDISENTTTTKTLSSILGDLRPDVATIKTQVQQTGERVRRIEAQQDAQQQRPGPR